jgi:hypothetical protein
MARHAAVAARGFQQQANLIIDQGVEHHARFVVNTLDDFLQLALVADQWPHMLDRLHLLELRETGPRDTADGFAGGVGDEMKMQDLHGRKWFRDDMWMTGIRTRLRTSPRTTGSLDPIFAPRRRDIEQSFPDL